MEPRKPFEEVIHILTDALTRERVDLLAGEFSALPAYAETKTTYLSHLDAYLSGPEMQQFLFAHKQKVKALQKLALENEKILLSTKQGIKSAQQRITHLEKIESIVGTYTESGAQLQMQSTSATCKKIA